MLASITQATPTYCYSRPAVQLLSEQTGIHFHNDTLDSGYKCGTDDICGVFAQLRMDLVSLHDIDHHETHIVSTMEWSEETLNSIIKDYAA